jgi:hypothetical protein
MKQVYNINLTEKQYEELDLGADFEFDKQKLLKLKENIQTRRVLFEKTGQHNEIIFNIIIRKESYVQRILLDCSLFPTDAC